MNQFLSEYGLMIGLLIALGAIIWFVSRKKTTDKLEDLYRRYKNQVKGYQGVTVVLGSDSREVIDLIELQRAREISDVWLSFLEVDSFMCNLALVHNVNMIANGETSHENFGIRASIMKDRGALAVGEVVAYGHATNAGIVNHFMKSKAHRKTILDKKYTHVGISIRIGKDQKRYCTVIFAKFKTKK